MRALRVWMGEIDEVVAINEHPMTCMAGESLTNAIVRFRSGKTASFNCLVMDAPLSKQPFFRIQGTKGEIVLEVSYSLPRRTVLLPSLSLSLSLPPPLTLFLYSTQLFSRSPLPFTIATMLPPFIGFI
eukprot:COSAG05_NODE_3719_length_1884_cov_151.360784_2_plen_128_part_00